MMVTQSSLLSMSAALMLPSTSALGFSLLDTHAYPLWLLPRLDGMRNGFAYVLHSTMPPTITLATPLARAGPRALHILRLKGADRSLHLQRLSYRCHRHGSG